MVNPHNPENEHFVCELELRDSLNDYYGEVLATQGTGFSAKKLQPYIEKVAAKKLFSPIRHLIEFAVKINLFTGSFGQKLQALLATDREATALVELHNKSAKYSYEKGEIPFFFLDSRILNVATELKIKSKKYQKAIQTLEQLELMRGDSQAQLAVSLYQSLPSSITKLLEGILQIEGHAKSSIEGQNTLTTLQKFEKITDSSGKSIMKQLAHLLAEKRVCLDDLCVINALLQTQKQKHKNALIAQLTPETKKLVAEKELTEVRDILREKLAQVKKITHSVLQEADGKLSIYEASTDRLATQFGEQVLDHPVSVTMIGVEYAGLVKEGGLAEALEGLAQGLVKQHPDNSVRLIFPKFSTLPKAVLEALSKTTPEIHTDSHGKPFSVYKHQINNVDCYFIDHERFTISGPKQSIYEGSNQEMKERFTIFSSLAADLLAHLPKPTIIHLHDWHVAGVALKLRNQQHEIAPIVFTYHNNQRMAQGRYFNEVYNYDPTIQGLQQANIAKENVNLMVEAIRSADAVNTVSTTFAVESQSIERGEGVSFAIRQAAREGKLSGIVNGTNVDRWNPEIDPALKKWQAIETKTPLDLSYGAEASDLMQKKKIVKAELQGWIKQEFPDITFDTSKPIVTYVGRYDWYQKGMDRFEEAIRATLKNGGQFICMGSLEDAEASKVLERIQKKYKNGVLVIRDYKTAEGKFYYQQGTSSRAGIGSVVRAASDFVFIPSRFEPCGLVQFESWLFGARVIASKVGGLVDTVIPPGQSKATFNGYLFDRDTSSGTASLSSIIKEALGDLAKESQEEQQQVASRLMKDGKKYGWDGTISGYTPAERYRFVYANASLRARSRQEAKPLPGPTFDIQRYRHLLRQTPMPNEQQLLEEKYLELYYKSDVNVEKLVQVFKKIPKGLREQLPSPYSLQVKSAEYEHLGAHFTPEATTFRLSAGGANTIYLQLYDSNEQPLTPQLMKRSDGGLWELNVANLIPGTQYQFIIDGQPRIDPYGLESTPVKGPKDIPRSVISTRDFTWSDQSWMAARENRSGPQPMSIYELHPTSWQTKEGKYLNYRELAEKLVSHCQETGYTHVELMGILEHPDQRSYGYQVSNFFSPNSRMGSLQDFKYLIDHLHKHKISVILDWIPAHFSTDDYALTKFDGTNQFEPSKIALFFSVRYFFTTLFGTKAFDYKKPEVRDFLYSSAAYWLKEMHVDALRVDAVQMILSSDDKRSAKVFLRTLNDFVHKQFPGVTTIAEDYSGSLRVTKATTAGGFGFDYKWNFNWSKHILDYLAVAPKKRPDYYNRLIQSIEGDLFHKMVMAISHDEILHSPLIEVTPGLNERQKCANMRVFLALMMTLPGKKLLFMGADSGSDSDWNSLVHGSKGMLDTIAPEERKKLTRVVAELNTLYKTQSAFHTQDDNAHDLAWIEKNDPEGSFIAFRRSDTSKDSFACFHNFSIDTAKIYEVDAINLQSIQEAFNSNNESFGGTEKQSQNSIQVVRDVTGRPVKYIVTIAPLSSVIVKETLANVIATK